MYSQLYQQLSFYPQVMDISDYSDEIREEKDGKVVSISFWSYASLRTQQAIATTD